MPKLLSVETKDKVVEMYLDGFTGAQILAQTGVGNSSLDNIIKERGIVRNRLSRPMNPVHEETIRALAKRDEQVDKLLADYRETHTLLRMELDRQGLLIDTLLAVLGITPGAPASPPARGTRKGARS